MENVVIIGLGAISTNHIKPVMDNAVLYGVCDIVKEKADAAAQKYGCKAFYDYKDVAEDKNVSSVHILTPHYLHFPMAELFSRSGKRIVLEKPAVMNRKEYDSLMKIFNENGTDCCIMLQNRYNPCIVYLKENFDKLDMGSFLGSKGILTWYRDKSYYESGEWRGKYDTEGGGLLINQCPHIIDLLTYFGGKVKTISGTASHHVLSDVIEVEDTSEAVIWFENNTRSLFYGTNGFVCNSPYDMEFIFERGYIRYIYGKLFKVCDGEIKLLCVDCNTANGEKSYWGSSHETVIKNFYKNMNYPKLEDYDNALKIMDYLIEKGKK